MNSLKRVTEYLKAEESLRKEDLIIQLIGQGQNPKTLKPGRMAKEETATSKLHRI
jgi:hypothetical protein